MIGRAGVLGDALFDECGRFVGEFGGAAVCLPAYGQCFGGAGNKAAGGVGLGFDKGDIGLDVDNGRAVEKVAAAAFERDAVCSLADVFQFEQGEAQMVGAVGAAGGEYAYFLFAAQARRANHLRPAFALGIVEDKVYPDVFEILQAAHAVGCEFAVEDDADFGGGNETGLAGDAEFLGVGRADGADGGDGVLHDADFAWKLADCSTARGGFCYNMRLFARWPGMEMIVSIDVDAQQTFTPLCPSELPVSGGDEIVAELNAQAALADLRVMTKDAHSPSAKWLVGSHDEMLRPTGMRNADLTWVSHAMVGTKGFDLLDGLPDVGGYDYCVWKGVDPELHPYGACFHDIEERLSTGLLEWLAAKNAQTVLVGGLATDYCVKQTVLQLLKGGSWRVIVNAAACRGIAPETVEAAWREMQTAGAVVLKNAQEIRIYLKSII